VLVASMHIESGDVDGVGRLRREICVRLLALGWTVRGQLPSSVSAPFAAGAVGSFCIPLENRFAAVVMYGWLREDESSPLSLAGQVGVDYLPARDLLYALAGSDVSGLVMQEPCVQATVSSSEDSGRAADRLAAFADEQVDALERTADVDTLVASLTAGRALPVTRSAEIGLALDMFHPPTDAVSSQDIGTRFATAELIPALLAGAGRRDEARRALETYAALTGNEEEVPRQYRRTVRQIARWLDVGSAALPTSPPFWPADPTMPMPSTSLAEALAEALPQARARGRAVAAARGLSENKTREELRPLLMRELNREGATMDEQSMEAAVDLLAAERQTFGKARVALHALSALGAFTRKRHEATSTAPPLQQLDIGPGRQPAWCRPPERASYPIASVGEHTAAVDLNRDAYAFLERVVQLGVSGLGGVRYVQVWFTLSSESEKDGSGLDVHIGAQRVGKLDASVAEYLTPAMEAAADRDEDPWMIASLTTSTDEVPYVLKIRGRRGMRRS
jgi:hypothetical protein